MSTSTAPLYEIRPTEEWVKHFEVPTIAHKEDSPFFYPLVDYQERILDNEIHSYRNTYQCVMDASRVEDASLYLTELHQGSQRLLIHEVSIIRNGEKIDALDEENISAIQRERSLESHIVDNRITVSITVDDLRESDHIQYRSTVIETSNEHPFHGRHFSYNYALSWGCPVDLQVVRVINESSTPLDVLEGKLVSGKQDYQKCEVQPSETFERLYEDLKSEPIPDAAASDVWGSFIQITTRVTWLELSRYLYTYYQANNALTPLTENQLTELAIFAHEDEQKTKALNIIRFVQNSVRYRGEHHGVFTHTPREPQRTLKKRAGDCKDKSNLMVAMLSAVGVDARLVLVHSRNHVKTAEFNPSPYHFNHMIVEVLLDEKTYYLDATIQKQQGDFDHLGELEYGFSLPLSAEGSEPVDIRRSFDKPTFKLEHTFNFPREPEKQTLTVKRRFDRHRADNMRSYFTRNEKARYQNDFLQWAKDDTELNLEIIKPITIIEDDTTKNRICTIEEYKILDLAKTHKDRNVRLACDFYRDFPVSDQPEFALRVDLDGQLEHIITANYDTRPEVEPTSKELKTDIFEYSDRVYAENNSIIFTTKVKPLKMRVESGDAAKQHFEAVDQMRQRSVNMIPHKNASRFGRKTESVFASGTFWGVLAFVAYIVFKGLMQD